MWMRSENEWDAMSDNLASESLDWANTHIKRFGDTDILPVPFEYCAIQHTWNTVRQELQDLDLGEYECRPLRRFLVPKPRGGFRATVQLDPLDTLIYTAIVYEAAEALEQQRIPVERRIACSYRLAIQQDGMLYRAADGWSDFAEFSEELAKSGTYSHVVLADITDFYNQISHHRVRNILESAGVSADRAENLENFLMNLTPGHSRGIPVGPSGSILLAEACMADVDSFLLRQGYTHTRYVDDFRIFCKSRSEAVRALHDLSEYLYTSHRLAIKPDRAEPLTIDEFSEHYLLDPEKHEKETRSEKLQHVAEMLRDFTGYHIDPDELDKSDKREAITENLAELFDSCLSQQTLHLGWARFLLRNATTMKTNVLVQKTLDNLETLVPVMRDAAKYLAACVTDKTSDQIGKSLVAMVDESDWGRLPLVRLWVLDVLVDKLAKPFEQEILRIAQDSSRLHLETRPTAMLAKARAHVDWVRAQKETWQNYAPWDRRAVVWAGSALSGDELHAWINRVENAGDSLDKAVAKSVAAA